MNKYLKLGLNDFPTTPNLLRENPQQNTPKDEIKVNLQELFHHVFIEAHGEVPPEKNYEYLLYKSHVKPQKFLRFKRKFLGPNKELKVDQSNKLGRGFCRWFLHKHCGITYFEYLENIIGGKVHQGFGDFRIQRSNSGNIPDFCCAKNTSEFFFAEAKGTAGAINFNNSKFDSWRDQFDTVEVLNENDNLRSVKGYIVATRLLDESKFPNVKPKLLAEDPRTKGDQDLDNEDNSDAVINIIANHYSNIFEILRLPFVSYLLKNNTQSDRNNRFQIALWEGTVPPINGKLFIGGYYSNYTLPFYKFENSKLVQLFGKANLSSNNIPFFGLELSIAKTLREATFRGQNILREIQPFTPASDIENISDTDNLSILRDGTIFSILDYFKPIEILEF